MSTQLRLFKNTGDSRSASMMLLLMVLAIATSPSWAVTPTAVGFTTPPPNTVNATLEGCRNDGSITFPSSASLPLICPDSAYTTGNLGKGWSELDLVPHRLVLRNGNSSGDVQYNLIVAGDYTQGSSAVGYDVITAVTKNVSESNASCVVSDTSGGSLTVSGVTGGTDTTIYRTIQVTQPPSSTCVFDFDMRLALGAHNFPGSSLQSYKFESANFSTGKATISIPVKEIQPQSISKTMTAVQGSDTTWSIGKTVPANLTFPNVCDTTLPLSKPVSIVVTWMKTPVSGGIAITATVSATNPSSRTITVNVTDKLYLGTSQSTLLDTANSGDIDVPANTSVPVLTHTFTDSVNSDATSYNDVATATYTDKLTQVPVTGNTTASFTANVIQGSTTNGQATVNDVEGITGTGNKFSVTSYSPVMGTFTNPSGYSLNDLVTSLTWATDSNSISSSGSITFNKSISYSGSGPGSGTLSDIATLTTDGGFTTDSGTQTIAVAAEAQVSLTIQKTINPFATGTYTFHVFNSLNSEVATPTITFNSSDSNTKSVTVSNLQPDTYTVTEDAVTGWATVITGSPINLTAASLATCSGTVSVSNTKYAHIIVKKVTNPSPDPTNASFPFTSNYGSAFNLSNGQTNDSGQLAPGSYSVTEGTLPTGWKLTGLSCQLTDGTNSSVGSQDGSNPKKANITLYAGDTVTCTFTNATSRVRVTKTLNGGAITGNNSFVFQLRSGASASAAGTILESETFNSTTSSTLFTTLLVPGQTYQICEQMLPGWTTTLGPPLYSVFNPSGDNSVVCTDFTATAGQTTAFSIDNGTPPGGMALTIGFWKNWASCAGSNGKQKPVLDQTLAKFPSTGLVVSATSGTYVAFGATYYLQLYSNSCSAAVNLLNKATVGTGQKMSSDPAFNLAAQLIGAELNFQAGAGKTSAAISAVNQSVLLLGKYQFNGNTHTKISNADATAMNNLANILNNYNNNI